MKKSNRNTKMIIILGIVAVAVLVIIALLLGDGLRQRTNAGAGDAATLAPSVTTAPSTTVTTAPPTTVTTAPPPTEPEVTGIMVITHTWRPFLEDAPDFGELDVTEVDAYHLIKCNMEGTNAVYGGAASSLYWAISFMPEMLEKNLQNVAVTYDVRTNYGELSHYDNGYITDGKHGVYAAGSYFDWKGHDLWSMTGDGVTFTDVLEQVGGVWVDVVVKVEDNIVGCAIFEIVPYQHFGLTARYVCSEYYPQVNGRYQPITEEFVQERLNACHRD